MKKGTIKTWIIKCDCGCNQKLEIEICYSLVGGFEIAIGTMKPRQKKSRQGVQLFNAKSIKNLAKIMDNLTSVK